MRTSAWRSKSVSLAVVAVLSVASARAEVQLAAVTSDPTLLRTAPGERQSAPPAGKARPFGELRAAVDDAPTVARITVGAGRTTFEGTGSPSTLVEVSEGAQLIGVAPVDDGGRWVLTVDRPLAAGDHRIATAARDPARARVTAGQDVLISIPEGYTGTTILSQRAATGTESAAADTQRRRIAEQAAAAEERFAEVMSSPEWRRIAQASPAPVRPAPAGPAVEAVRTQPVRDTAAGNGMFGWFDKASRDYHDLVVKRLADPRPLPTDGLAPRVEAPRSTVTAPLPAPPVAAPAQPKSTVSEKKLSPPATQETSMLESLQSMLERAGRDYHEGVVRKLAQPTGEAAPKPLGPMGPAARIPDGREAEALRRADEERRAAEVRRLAEQQKAAAKSEPVTTEQPAAADAAAIEARRLEAEQRMAAARRADEERRAEEARQDAARKQAEAAKRAEDEKRAAELAKADEAKRAAEAAQQREAQRKAETDRQKQAALDDAQRKAQEAAQQRADDQRRALEAAAAAAARKAQEEAEQRQRVEAQRLATAKAAEDARRAEAERRRVATEAKPVTEAVPPSRLPSGYRTEQDYRRAMEEASRAPKVAADAQRPERAIEAPARPQPRSETPKVRPETPTVREAAPPAPPKTPSGFRTEEEYRRALIEASRAPKVASAETPAQPRPRATVSRAEAERAAREMLLAERSKVAELKAERDRKAAERKRAEELRIAAAAPKVIEPGQQYRKRPGTPVIEEGSATKAVPAAAPGRSVPPPREERKVAECPAAGRRVSLPGTYVVKSGDTLWKIAERFYGDGEAYTRILKANKGRVPDPDVIEPCRRLVLPRR